MKDFLFRGSLADLDLETYELTQLEAERQARKLILIPSESQAPMAVREALASVFQNIYAEGYPDEETRWMTEEQILDYPARLAHYRRYSDPRYYKGVEYADAIEALARRRCAEVFAANGFTADQIFVNVQALSGAPANNAVYHALLEPGDVVLGMNLLHGGHLTHGSSVNRSGRYYKAVHYAVDPQTERIDYEAVAALARQHRPKLIIAGYSSYPWMPDWKKFRAIADEVGAYLLADLSHIGGMVAAGVVPSPVGIAHVVTSTTHKSLTGPRGAVILTTDAALARKIDRAVFPGEQGGPHVHVFAALALTFKLAKTDQFKKLQAQTLKNAVALSDQLKSRGLRIPFGGTDTHLVNVDVTVVKGPDGTSLSGDQAARILDIAGIVVNRNTIPGDKNSADPSGIRLGTPWITQRGFDEKMTRALADIIADVLLKAVPHSVDTPRQGIIRRAKVPFEVLEDAKLRVRALAAQCGLDFTPMEHGYPHFYYLDDKPRARKGFAVYEMMGARARQFLDYASAADLSALTPGSTAPARFHLPGGSVDCVLTCVDSTHYRLTVPEASATRVATWLRDLSDGYVLFGDDPLRRLPGPVVVSESGQDPARAGKGQPAWNAKPWCIGIEPATGTPLPAFHWEEKESGLRRTPLYEVHKALGAKIIPFAGWEMPVWYTTVVEEHLATRQAAGLFDVAHMGVYEVAGADAAAFLDTVCANDIGNLKPGESLYTHFLLPDAQVVDDTLVYRRALDKFLVVVNASNDDKDRTWLEAVRDGRVRIDDKRPWARTYGYNAVIRNLRDPKSGEDMRVDIALQGPKSRDILLALGVDSETRARILKLKRTELCDAKVGAGGAFDLIVSRTGYTGEKMAFELFVHPERAVEFWHALLKAGEPFGLKPVGLGARDSLRTEAGLPLYGHEMGLGSGKFGAPDLGVAEGGFGGYVKPYKPYFIGREAYLANEKVRKGVVVRFRFDEQRVRMAHNGDPVVNAAGERIGWVTSCAIDSERFLTGQAYVELKYAVEGTPILIHQGGAMDRPPSAARVVSRFPKI